MNYFDDQETISADEVLQNINYFVTIKQSELYMYHYHTIVDYMLGEMKQNNLLFRSLYNGYNLVGSYPDRLKVTKPDEFDVNIRLKFKNDDLVAVKSVPGQPGFCTINLRHCKRITDNTSSSRQILHMIDENWYLLQDRVNDWMHNIVKSILNKLKKRDNIYLLQIDDSLYKLSFMLSGPAYTLKLTVINTHIKFSIDLAIGFVFDKSHWVASRKYRKDFGVAEWYAVPKPTSTNCSKSRSFICSYSNLERTFLYDLNAMKCLLRFFKKLRDTQNLTNLISYHIKTIFLWEINKNSCEFWENSLMELFLIMFEKILEVYGRKSLPSFWDPGYNLLGKFDSPTLIKLERQLRKIYKQILRNETNNPEYLVNVFLTPGEIKEYYRRN